LVIQNRWPQESKEKWVKVGQEIVKVDLDNDKWERVEVESAQVMSVVKQAYIMRELGDWSNLVRDMWLCIT